MIQRACASEIERPELKLICAGYSESIRPTQDPEQLRINKQAIPKYMFLIFCYEVPIPSREHMSTV